MVWIINYIEQTTISGFFQSCIEESNLMMNVANFLGINI